MKILRVNELHKSTYYRAGHKAISQGQKQRGDKLLDYGFKRGSYKKYKKLEGLSMDIFIGFALNNDPNGPDEISPRKVYTDFRFPDHIDDVLDDEVFIALETYHNIHISFSISFENDKPSVMLFDTDNYFTDRRSARNFLKGLKVYYEVGKAQIDKEKLAYKVNTGEEPPKNMQTKDNNLYTFLRDKGYDFDKFVNDIGGVNSLWDYPPNGTEVV